MRALFLLPIFLLGALLIYFRPAHTPHPSLRKLQSPTVKLLKVKKTAITEANKQTYEQSVPGVTFLLDESADSDVVQSDDTAKIIKEAQKLFVSDGKPTFLYKNNIATLHQQDVLAVVKGNIGKVVIFVKSQHCHWCILTEPLVRDAALKSSTPFLILDAEEAQLLMQYTKIEGFPTILKIDESGNIYKFAESRTVENIVAFAL